MCCLRCEGKMNAFSNTFWATFSKNATPSKTILTHTKYTNITIFLESGPNSILLWSLLTKWMVSKSHVFKRKCRYDTFHFILKQNYEFFMVLWCNGAHVYQWSECFNSISVNETNRSFLDVCKESSDHDKQNHATTTQYFIMCKMSLALSQA